MVLCLGIILVPTIIPQGHDAAFLVCTLGLRDLHSNILLGKRVVGPHNDKTPRAG
jgi:hypothetical protein